uniref:NFX1-type zinc finger-containing protein 1 n=1 Tax=Panagrolaimus sp. PS1159 TaxID=55785 RepID=A0AC35FW60_9BILA
MTKNRLCVALSRARIGMYIIGNIEYLADRASSTLWQEIKETFESKNYLSEHLITKCQKHGTEQIIKSFKEFNFKCPEGGCQRQCEDILECGHICALYCHGYDMEHLEIKCEQPCQKICYHNVQCQKLCHEECEPCEFNESENGNCYYFISESSNSAENTLEVETKKQVVEECSREAEISFFLDGL